MHDLMAATGETSNLGIERNGEVMFVSQVETTESIRAFFPPGSISPMHASGIGKALLGSYSDTRLERFLKGRTFERFTDRTIGAPEALRADLARIRARGWAFDNEERTLGMRCVAAPIVDIYGQPVAGISVSGPVQRMAEDKIERIGALVRDAAHSVSRGLGAPE
jgi:IclR family acetate operon transcriptional repressor